MLSLTLDVTFGQTKINQEDFMRELMDSYTEILGFDVSMNE
jgi:hypothetical protein